MTDIADRDPKRVYQAGAGNVPVRARLSAADFLLQFWRAKWLMALIALPILTGGLFIASQMPKTFESRSALYVTSGDQVRSTPSLSDARFDQGLSIQEALQGEIQILNTRLVAERTLSRFPLSRIYPDIADADLQKSIDRFQKSFSVTARPNSNIIAVRVTHPDPATAAELLNAAIAVYLQRRPEVFGSSPVDQLRAERKRAERDLLEAEDAARTFLDTNAIRDFANERSTAQGLYTIISNEISAAEARKKAVQGQLTRTRRQLTDTAPEQALLIEDPVAVRLRDLEIERNQALVNYTADSRRVQAIDRQISELRAQQDASEGLGDAVRRAPNPTYQALEASKNRLEAESDSLSQKGAELARQLNAVEEKLDRFMGLESEWNELQRNRELIEANIRALGAQEQSEGSAAGIAANSVGSVKVTEPATVPSKGSSLSTFAALLTLLIAVFSAFITGLMRAHARHGIATASSFQRTTGLPVLATVGRA